MLKPAPLDETEQGLASLVSSRNAIRFIYDESIAAGNADITRIIEEALSCCDDLIEAGLEISYKSQDALFYFYFLRAILGLKPKDIAHLVDFLQWLKIIPSDNYTVA